MNIFSKLESWNDSKARESLIAMFESYQTEEVILIVPPVAHLDRPSLALHILQACAAKYAGTGVSVFYGNIAFGAWIGEEINNMFSYLSPSYLLSERLFAETAYGNSLLGKNAEVAFNAMLRDYSKSEDNCVLSFSDLQTLALEAKHWVSDIAKLVVSKAPKVVGCSTSFEQTAASVALLNAIKDLSPETITIIGGPNCAADMAEGVASLSASIDYIFSGDGEIVFPTFLKQMKAGNLSKDRIIRSLPCLDMDLIPTPNYKEFYDQLSYLIEPLPRDLCIPFESSRGCWWGEKHQCTFCGLNSNNLKYRKKSPIRVVEELEELVTSYPAKILAAYDSIMPQSYYTEFLPLIKDRFNEFGIFYEQRSNINLKQMGQLKEAKVDIIQPGIEAISTSLLKRMNKGIRTFQNIATMRYARIFDVAINWNLLYGFPGDQKEDYEETLRYLPLLHHLTPPILFSVKIERFSLYFYKPSEFGIKNLRPLDSYSEVLPEHVDPRKIAYRFTCEYDSGSLENPEIIDKLKNEITLWRSKWLPKEEINDPRVISPPEKEETLPALKVTKVANDKYTLVDTRGIAENMNTQTISHEQAYAALVTMSLKKLAISREVHQWAIANKVAIEIDGMHVALATANPDLLGVFEAQNT
ncbi:MAG: hypothetical protein DRR16_07185 [Candidatus Parabeggiatoa sp. nov. 3]|nr:MAG: hypothetical protein DRR00_00960 [Gammaproteobacteria bacterium]RKZ66483.1 MAG: hypothetical protein DRQ99_09605 [Gammaproteobacteria bacterium]RKZ87488.1 MAG: hypothetical protein DRR16_07185 [Gammaproteobacteria bacterium]